MSYYIIMQDTKILHKTIKVTGLVINKPCYLHYVFAGECGRSDRYYLFYDGFGVSDNLLFRWRTSIHLVYPIIFNQPIFFSKAMYILVEWVPFYLLNVGYTYE